MLYRKSNSDKLSQALAPIKRKLEDFTIFTLGTKVQLLRIDMSEPDLRGDTTETLRTQIINNCIVQHPGESNIQMFGTIDEATRQSDASSINIWDLLPITIKFPFSGTQGEDPVSLIKGDLLVECLFDEHNNKIPLIMQVTRNFGGFFMKQIVTKKVECCLFRGSLSSDIKTAIDIYLQSLNNS